MIVFIITLAVVLVANIIIIIVIDKIHYGRCCQFVFQYLNFIKWPIQNVHNMASYNDIQLTEMILNFRI